MMGHQVQWLIGAIVLLTASAPAFADEVHKVLRAWSDHRLRNPQSGVHFTARLYTYDQVFQTETRAVVECWMRPTGESRLDFTPSEPAPGEVSRKAGRGGEPYALRARRSERWLFTPQRVRQLLPGANPGDQPMIHHLDLSLPKREGSGDVFEALAERMMAPWQEFGMRVSNSMMIVSDLPQLLEGPRRELWHVRLGTLHGVKDRIHLVLTPASETISGEFSQLEVLLRRDFTPVAFRSFDPAGTSETVYAYSSWLPLEDDTDAFTEESVTRWPRGREAARHEPADDFPPPPPVAVMP